MAKSVSFHNRGSQAVPSLSSGPHVCTPVGPLWGSELLLVSRTLGSVPGWATCQQGGLRPDLPGTQLGKAGGCSWRPGALYPARPELQVNAQILPPNASAWC